MRTDHQLSLMSARIGSKKSHAITQVANELTYLVEKHGVQLGKKIFIKNVIPGSILHHIMTWPKGYQGDWHIIEKIYHKQVFDKSENWDYILVGTQEGEAVRNRPYYLCTYLNRRLFKGKVFVDVGCGSGLAIRPLIFTGNLNGAKIVLIDQDGEALEQAQKNLINISKDIDKVFLREDVLKLKNYFSNIDISIIWSSGVFDYLGDQLMIRVLQNWLGTLASGGEIIIGNMSKNCPNRESFIVFGWDLHFRTADQLLEIGNKIIHDYLGSKALLGIDHTGCNYFLHLIR